MSSMLKSPMLPLACSVSTTVSVEGGGGDGGSEGGGGLGGGGEGLGEVASVPVSTRTRRLVAIDLLTLLEVRGVR